MGQLVIEITAEGAVRRVLRADDAPDERRLISLYGDLTREVDALARAAKRVGAKRRSTVAPRPEAA